MVEAWKVVLATAFCLPRPANPSDTRRSNATNLFDSRNMAPDLRRNHRRTEGISTVNWPAYEA